MSGQPRQMEPYLDKDELIASWHELASRHGGAEHERFLRLISGLSGSENCQSPTRVFNTDGKDVTPRHRHFPVQDEKSSRRKPVPQGALVLAQELREQGLSFHDIPAKLKEAGYIPCQNRMYSAQRLRDLITPIYARPSTSS
jgi:hypothetical protein